MARDPCQRTVNSLRRPKEKRDLRSLSLPLLFSPFRLLYILQDSAKMSLPSEITGGGDDIPLSSHNFL